MGLLRQASDDLARDIAHIKGKVDMLNDWHNEVNRNLAVFDERLKWILRLAVLALILSAGEEAMPYIVKYLGG